MRLLIREWDNLIVTVPDWAQENCFEQAQLGTRPTLPGSHWPLDV